MNRKFLLIFCGFAVMALVMVFQATQSSKAMVLSPKDLAAVQEGRKLHRIRVGGKVAPDSIVYNLQPQLELKFEVQEREGEIKVPVIYSGLKPDMFESGRDVLIDGEYVDGKIIASKLLTQCPSKYEPPDPSKRSYEAHPPQQH